MNNMNRAVSNIEIRDDSGGLADAVISKYLSKAKLGNFTSMVYGLIDVRLYWSCGNFPWNLRTCFRIDINLSS